jgi:hypothetical protein
MTSARLVSAATVLTVVLYLLSAAPAAAGESTTRYVDDDGRAGPVRGCGGHRVAFKRIQAAVNASRAGDRILVCAGIFRGQVTISGHDKDGLRLLATKQWHGNRADGTIRGGDSARGVGEL